MPRLIYFLWFALCCSFSTAHAGGVYQEPDAFIKEVFGDTKPEVKVLWPDAALKQQMQAILGHPYKSLRIRYWLHAKRSAWILDEIGKDQDITTGIVINDDKLETLRILVFRESRGWEVRHDFFTRQFDSARLNTDHQLNVNIDNISGATLSVRAVSKQARLALLLHKHVTSTP